MFLCLAIDSREPLWSHPILKKHSITLLVIYFINSSHLASLHSNIGLFNSVRILCSLQVTFLILQSAKYIQGEIWGNHRDYIFYFLPRRESRSCAAYCKILKNICFIHFLIFSLFWAEKRSGPSNPSWLHEEDDLFPVKGIDGIIRMIHLGPQRRAQLMVKKFLFLPLSWVKVSFHIRAL